MNNSDNSAKREQEFSLNLQSKHFLNPSAVVLEDRYASVRR